MNLESENSTHGTKVLKITIEGKSYEWNHQYITGAQIKKLAGISEHLQIVLAIAKPWDDEQIGDDDRVDLARPGIEHFFVRHEDKDKLVEIRVNDVERKISPGRHSVAEIKKIGQVPENYELEELIDRKLTPLKDDGIVTIQGCEEFFGHVRDGKSS